MRGKRGEQGQATVEWVGLVLVAALVLGALAALRSPVEGRGLGEAVAERITCAARGACGKSTAPGPGARRPSRLLRAPAKRPPVRPSREAEAFQRLRGAGWLAKRAWIACLGYRRWRYEYEHPRSPTQPLPLNDALKIANTCLNPLAFLAD